MIRALIGRFVLHCISRAQRRSWDREWRRYDVATMTDGQISDLVHGYPIRDLPPSAHAAMAPNTTVYQFGSRRT